MDWQGLKGALCCLLVAGIVHINHFSRDAPGTMENQIVLDPNLKVTPARYAALTSVYFTPSVIVPLLLGLLTNSSQASCSPALVYLCCAWVSVVGNCVAVHGVVTGNYSGLLAGRAVCGMAYEALDMLPLAFVPPLVPGAWAIWNGILSFSLRLGSVVAFVLLPRVYTYYSEGGVHDGMRAVFITVALYGGLMGPVATLMYATVRSMPAKVHPPEMSLSMMSAFRALPRVFWVYALGGMLRYGSVVPFWFYGSGYLQRAYGITPTAAGNLMVLPEGLICVLSLPIAVLLDRYELDFADQQRVQGVACACIALSYVLMLMGAPAVVGVAALGCSYSVANCTFWTAFVLACPEHLSALGSGIVASLVNIGATVVPAILGEVRTFLQGDKGDVAMLAILGVQALASCAVAFASASGLLASQGTRSSIHETELLVHDVDMSGPRQQM